MIYKQFFKCELFCFSKSKRHQALVNGQLFGEAHMGLGFGQKKIRAIKFYYLFTAQYIYKIYKNNSTLFLDFGTYITFIFNLTQETVLKNLENCGSKNQTSVYISGIPKMRLTIYSEAVFRLKVDSYYNSWAHGTSEFWLNSPLLQVFKVCALSIRKDQ